MRRQHLLLALLLLTIAVGAAYLVGRQSRLTSLSAGGSADGAGNASSKAPSSVDLEAQLERSERQSLVFSRRIGELEQELGAGGPTAKTAQEGARLAAIETGLQSTLQTLQEVSRAQTEQGGLLKMLGELREIVSKPAANAEGLDALMLKITALEAASGKTAGEIGAVAQSVTKLGESLEKFLEDQAASSGTREGEISKLANEIDRFHETISQASSDLKSLRDELLSAELHRVTAVTPAPSTTVDATARPPMAAEIRAVDRLKGVVILDKGKSHGLEKDDLFEITRLGRSIGKVRVIRLWDTYSGAEIVKVLPGEKVENGDGARRHVGGRPEDTKTKSADSDTAAAAKTPAKTVISGAQEKRSPPPPPPGN